MKTFKFFSIFFVVMTMFALTSYSQGNVKTTKYHEPTELIGVQFEDVPETVTGSYDGYETVWLFHDKFFQYQWRGKGTYTGDETGTIYYTSVVVNYNFKSWMPGLQLTDTYTMHIRDESGTFHNTYHYTWHATINANGEITNDFFKEH